MRYSIMTYEEWVKDHDKKLQEVLLRLKDSTVEEIIDYFDFEHMVQVEPDFCPLYATNTKCHNIDSLNCLFCACPHFEYSDELPFTVKDGYAVMSQCSINSRFAGEYTTNYEDHAEVQCDCSGCTVPHTKAYARQNIERVLTQAIINDSISLLELIRGYQLADIFGKYKLF